MLTYQAKQVICATPRDPKEWSMNGKTGTTHSAVLVALGGDGSAKNITLKAKSAEDLKAKLAKYTPGKEAVIPILEIVPIFKSGDRKASDYELVG